MALWVAMLLPDQPAGRASLYLQAEDKQATMARKSTGGKAPRQQLATMAARNSAPCRSYETCSRHDELLLRVRKRKLRKLLVGLLLEVSLKCSLSLHSRVPLENFHNPVATARCFQHLHRERSGGRSRGLSRVVGAIK